MKVENIVCVDQFWLDISWCKEANINTLYLLSSLSVGVLRHDVRIRNSNTQAVEEYPCEIITVSYFEHSTVKVYCLANVKINNVVKVVRRVGQANPLASH